MCYCQNDLSTWWSCYFKWTLTQNTTWSNLCTELSTCYLKWVTTFFLINIPLFIYLLLHFSIHFCILLIHMIWLCWKFLLKILSNDIISYLPMSLRPKQIKSSNGDATILIQSSPLPYETEIYSVKSNVE